MSSPASPADPNLPPPAVLRRLASFVYEGVLLFGVLMIFGIAFSALTQQRHALVGRHGLQVFVFLLLGLYFAWFWTHGGQTVAMKAWQLRVVDRNGAPLRWPRAIARYLLAWLWFAPALVTLALAPIRSAGAISAILLAGVLGYAALARLHPQRQFVHDVLCGTQLVTWRPTPKP
jgi:uncharacterized RDD family membrane protein YckC